MERPRYEDFEMEYWDDNRYAFLGNGFDTREFDGEWIYEEDVLPAGQTICPLSLFTFKRVRSNFGQEEI